jgi:hypothetical protein
MRAVVHETDFVVPAYEVANGFVAILGVYDTGGVVDVDQIHQVANFSDEILRIREEKGIKPRRTREEMVAHVICEDAVDNNHKPGKTPNERYFAAINGVNEMIGYAALDRTVALPPHPVRIREFGISDQVNERSRAAYAGVLAAVLAGTLCHAEKRDGSVTKSARTSRSTERSRAMLIYGLCCRSVLLICPNVTCSVRHSWRHAVKSGNIS